MYQGEGWRFSASVVLCGIVVLLVTLWVTSLKINYSIISVITNFLLLGLLLQLNQPFKLIEEMKVDKRPGEPAFEEELKRINRKDVYSQRAKCEGKGSNSLYGAYVSLIIIMLVACGLSLLWLVLEQVLVEEKQLEIVNGFQWATNLVLLIIQLVIGGMFIHKVRKVKDCRDDDSRNINKGHLMRVGAFLIVAVIWAQQLALLIKAPSRQSYVQFVREVDPSQ